MAAPVLPSFVGVTFVAAAAAAGLAAHIPSNIKFRSVRPGPSLGDVTVVQLANGVGGGGGGFAVITTNADLLHGTAKHIDEYPGKWTDMAVHGMWVWANEAYSFTVMRTKDNKYIIPEYAVLHTVLDAVPKAEGLPYELTADATDPSKPWQPELKTFGVEDTYSVVYANEYVMWYVDLDDTDPANPKINGHLKVSVEDFPRNQLRYQGELNQPPCAGRWMTLPALPETEFKSELRLRMEANNGTQRLDQLVRREDQTRPFYREYRHRQYYLRVHHPPRGVSVHCMPPNQPLWSVEVVVKATRMLDCKGMAPIDVEYQKPGLSRNMRCPDPCPNPKELGSFDAPWLLNSGLPHTTYHPGASGGGWSGHY